MAWAPQGWQMYIQWRATGVHDLPAEIITRTIKSPVSLLPICWGWTAWPRSKCKNKTKRVWPDCKNHQEEKCYSNQAFVKIGQRLPLLCTGLFGQGLDAATSNLFAERGELASPSWTVDTELLWRVRMARHTQLRTHRPSVTFSSRSVLLKWWQIP